MDVFLPNIDEARNILGVGRDIVSEKVTGMLVDMGIKTVAVKLGEGGCWAADEDTVEYVPAFKVKAVDTTGAGDNFAAGFISGHISGKTLRQSAMIGSAAAALKIGGTGWMAYPERSQVNIFLHDRGLVGL